VRGLSFRPLALLVLLLAGVVPDSPAAACDPGASAGSAPAQCALNLNITAPQSWSQQTFNASVTVSWSAYLALTGADQPDVCVNGTFEGAPILSFNDSTGSATFRTNVSGTPALTLTATRPGCAPATRTAYLYVRPQPAQVVGFPELPPWLAFALAPAAYALWRRRHR
jgi:hypothetical protein